MSAITLNKNNYPIAIEAPDEIWQYIGSKLNGPWDRSMKDLFSFRSTNSYFYRTLLEPHWEGLFQKYFPAALATAPILINYSQLYRQCGLQLASMKKLSAPFLVFENCPFGYAVQGNLLCRSFLENSRGVIQVCDVNSGKLILGIKEDVSDLKKPRFYNNQLFAISEQLPSSSIVAWDVQTEKEVFRLDSGFEEIYNFYVEGKFIVVTGGFKRDFPSATKCWDIQTKELVVNHNASAGISNFILDGCLFIERRSQMTSYDLSSGQMTQYNFPPGSELMMSTVCDNYLVRSIYQEALNESSIEFCDFQGKLISKLDKACKGILVKLVSHYDHLISFSLHGAKQMEGEIKVWKKNSESFDCVNSVIIQDLYPCFLLHKDFLVTCIDKSSEGMRIEIRNPMTLKVISTIPLNGRLGHWQFHGDVLFANVGDSLTLWGMSQEPICDVLNSNLNILGAMAEKVYEGDHAELSSLQQKLHPHFQNDLEKVREELNSSEAILCLQTKVCLEVLFHAIHDKKGDRVRALTEQLKFINTDYANRLYGLLYEVCNPTTSNPKWAEDAFLGRNGCSASPEHMKQAVQALKRELRLSGQNVPLLLEPSFAPEEASAPAEEESPEVPLLSFLEITTPTDFSEKLGCRPGFLKTVGIYSTADLAILGIGLSHVQHLALPEASAVTLIDRRDGQLLLLEKKQEILNCLSGILAKAVENEEHPLFTFETNPWIALKEETAKLNEEIIGNSKSAQKLFALFEQTSHMTLIERANAFVDRCNTLEQQLMVKKMRSYLLQFGLLHKWKALTAEGLQTLSEYALRNPELSQDHFFRMGE